MVRQRPRSEVIIAVGLVAFIAVAFVKPWGSAPLSSDAEPTGATAASGGPTAAAGTTLQPVTDVAAGTIIASIPVPGPPVRPVVGAGALWYPVDVAHLLRVDVVTAETTDVMLDRNAYPGIPGLTGDGATLWLTGAADASIARFDAIAGVPRDKILPDPMDPVAIDAVSDATMAGGILWFVADVHATAPIYIDTPLGPVCCAGETSSMLYRVDTASGVMDRIHEIRGAESIRAGFGSIWILAQPTAADGPFIVNRINGESGIVSATMVLPSVAEPGACGACVTSFTVDSDSLWVPSGLGDRVVRIDPIANRIAATIDLGRDAEWAASAPDGSVWVAGGYPPGRECNPAVGYVVRIDPSTNRVRGRVGIPCPVSLAVAGGDVWVGTYGPAGPSIQRIRPTP